MNDSLLLLSSFIKDPKGIGTVAPSSKLLTREIINSIKFKELRYIVELGPGVGTFTKSILRKAPQDAKLFCFEVNKKFCTHLSSRIKDARFNVINDGAERLRYHLKKLGIEKVDCIVSGLPFFNFSEQKKRKILSEISNCLKENGRFILFQYTNGLGKLLESRFKSVERKFVAFNLPPSFVYLCEK